MGDQQFAGIEGTQGYVPESGNFRMSYISVFIIFLYILVTEHVCLK